MTTPAALVAAVLVLGAPAPSRAHHGARCHDRVCLKRVQIHQSGYPACNTWACVRRVDRVRARRAAAAFLQPNAHLRAIAACESGGDPRAVSSNGMYRGKYQFDYRTWSTVGGRGDPAAASEREQDHRAMLLYARRGAQPWPVCG